MSELEILGEIKSGGEKEGLENVARYNFDLRNQINLSETGIFLCEGGHGRSQDCEYRQLSNKECFSYLQKFIGRILNLQIKVGQLEAEVERLRKALKDMLWLFDRDLPPTSIGKRTCNEAKELIEGEK